MRIEKITIHKADIYLIFKKFSLTFWAIWRWSKLKFLKNFWKKNRKKLTTALSILIMLSVRWLAQPGSASGLGPEGRRFEPYITDHLNFLPYFFKLILGIFRESRLFDLLAFLPLVMVTRFDTTSGKYFERM